MRLVLQKEQDSMWHCLSHATKYCQKPHNKVFFCSSSNSLMPSLINISYKAHHFPSFYWVWWEKWLNTTVLVSPKLTKKCLHLTKQWNGLKIHITIHIIIKCLSKHCWHKGNTDVYNHNKLRTLKQRCHDSKLTTSSLFLEYNDNNVTKRLKFSNIAFAALTTPLACISEACRRIT